MKREFFVRKEEDYGTRNLVVGVKSYSPCGANSCCLPALTMDELEKLKEAIEAYIVADKLLTAQK